jgi:PAS domain S-box-containing protein
MHIARPDIDLFLWTSYDQNVIRPPNTTDIILDSINEGVFTVDAEWRVTSFNSAAEKITGVPRDEAIGRRCFEVFHANICENACALKKTMLDGKPIFNTTVHIVNHSGHRVPIRISTALLRDDQDQVIGGVETFQDLSQVEELKKELRARYSFQDIIGRSPAMMRLFELLPRIAESSSTVLLEGASGTGKELFARAIHNLSPRKHKRFVVMNCGALPDTLLESELFGYKAGAFTDAKRDKSGRFALADGGTILLDEIGDISPAMQVRLLRVLQERVVEPLGGIEPVKVNVRVVAATNRNLSELVKSDAFREDVYYRIRVIHLQLPTLQQRREDIPLLVDSLVGRFNRLKGKDVAGVSGEVMARLMDHDFPGNVRELENIIEQAFVLCSGGLIELINLPPELRPAGTLGISEDDSLTLSAMEKHLIVPALKRHNGNRKKAAHHLGIDTSTLFRKIKAYSIETPGADGRSKGH